MIRLLEKIWSMSEFAAAQEHLHRGETPVAVTGLGGVNQSLFAAAAANAMQRPVVFICTGEKEAERAAGDLAADMRLDVGGDLLSVKAKDNVVVGA